MRKFSLAFILFVFLASGLSACSSGLLSVHKIDVQQGNALNGDAVDKLKVGMVPEQVRFLLGHPLVTDPFHGDRWYYVYYFKPGNGQAEKRKVTVFFNEGRVARIDKPESAKLASR
jgi:outer membrane protein assembly factor BamE